MITKEQEQNIVKQLKPFQPYKVGVFGSYARGEQKENSDLDLLVHLGSQVTLFDLLELEEKLTEVLGINVDLVTEGSVNMHLRPTIEHEVKYILNG